MEIKVLENEHYKYEKYSYMYIAFADHVNYRFGQNEQVRKISFFCP